MFEKLATKWKVNGLQLFLVLFTFAVGGSLCGYISKKIISFIAIERGPLWIIIYIIILTITWPFCVMIVSIATGQFKFFKNYLYKIGLRLMRKKLRTRIAIFASGAGSNAGKIIEKFRAGKIEVALIVTNKPHAGVVQIAKDHNIPVVVIEKERFNLDGYVEEIKKYKIDWIILAGFLWKVPPVLIGAYRNRILNIHPALLPDYGGKGMYGHHVHAAVIGNKEKHSGISIHLVDEIYDHGKIIFQAKCEITENETPESLANKIHSLEHAHFPAVIEKTIMGN